MPLGYYFSLTITDGALFKRGHYSREGTIQERALFKRGHYSREGTTFFKAGTFASSSIKTKKNGANANVNYRDLTERAK